MPIQFSNAGVDPLWSGLDLDVQPGEFIAILGPNGSGKSTLLNTILGTRTLTSGSVRVDGRVGYIPQQQMFDKHLPVRARDLVSLSLGHGVFSGRRPSTHAVDEALAYVGAEGIADRSVGTLSGGQQQLIRQAQAFGTDPDVVLADEPLLSLDMAREHDTVARLHKHRAAVLFVTHGINPILDVVDRVLYLAPRGHMLGTIDEVMQTQVLSELYGTHVEVATVNGKMVVI